MVRRTNSGDTILDCDSDITFDSPEYSFDMACSELEFKGWNGHDYIFSKYTNVAGDEPFFYTSGPCKSYSRALAETIINSDIEGAIQKLLQTGFTPSEDCTLGFLLSRFGKITNMKKYYQWDYLPNNVNIRKQELVPLHNDQITSVGWAKHADYYFSQLPTGHDWFESYVLSKHPHIKKYSQKNDLPKVATIFTDGQNSLSECLKTLHSDGSYILILRNRDSIIDNETAKQFPSSLKRLYAVNSAIQNSVCIPIPVGTRTWGEPNELFGVVLSEKIERDADPNIFFQASLNCPRRKYVFEIAKGNALFTTLETDTTTDGMLTYLRNMKKHVFTAAPCGLGPDCLRSYETMIMGGIPILDDVPELRHFEDLPVVYTHDWNITPEWCASEIEKLKQRHTSTDRIRMSYWDSHIHDSKFKYINNTSVHVVLSPPDFIVAKPPPINAPTVSTTKSLSFSGGKFKLFK
jgi:hypothetical protein